MLTSEGTAYLLYARRILADLRKAEQSIADQSSPKGRLRVSISQLYGRMFVVPLLRVVATGDASPRDQRDPMKRPFVSLANCITPWGGYRHSAAIL